MIDFTKSNLFDREKTKFRKFLDNKLFTPDEHASRVETSDDTMNNIQVLDTQSFLGGSPIDFLGGGDDDYQNMWGGDDDASGERRRHVDMSNERMHETGVWWKDILYAPLFLIIYVFKSMIYDFPTKDEWKSILQAVQKTSIVTCVISLILWIFNFNFIFTLSFQAIAAALLFGLATSILKVLDKNDTEGANEEGAASGGDGFDFGGGDSDGGGFDFGGFDALGTDDQALDLDGANLSMNTGGGGFNFGQLFETPNSDQIVETVDTGKYKVLAPSPIVVDSKEEFERTLMNVFIANERYRGVEINDRKEIIESLHGYVITNDKKFGSWSVASPHSTEYNNVSYALFKGLGQIQNSFLTDEEAMIIMSIKSNPLLYKIEVELPNYFKLSQVQSKIKEIEDALRNGEADTNVQVFVSYYQGIFVFKFLRLDNRNLISLGDILRFYDEDKGGTALDAYADPKMGLPILLGLQNNEYPYIVDLEANTSGAIVGGSGSGKSWLTFSVLFSLILTNNYSNLNIVVFDKKNAAFWNQFARFPHVFGYHTNIENYLEQMRELYAEVNRRKDLLVQLNEENIKDYRRRLREEGEYEKLKEVPNLLIVVDEITSTMQNLESMYLDRDEIELYKEFRNTLAMITQEGRSLGVRLIVIGQRAIDNSIPKNVIANSSFKFAMKMDAESDFEIMMGKEVSSIPKPQAMGIGIAKTMGGGLQVIKTLTVGGSNEYQIIRLIRVLALEWVRRADGVSDIMNMPPSLNLPKCYNRNKFVEMSLKDLEEWRILSPSEVTKYRQDTGGGGGGFGFPQFTQQAETPLTTNEQEPPTFDFGTPTGAEPPMFDFGTPAGAEQPTFDFGTPTADEGKPPTFDFDTPTADEVKPPTFDFGTPTVEEPPTFDFGTADEVKPPTFDFGTPTVEEPPTFDFGTADEGKPPTFDFDTPTAEEPPTFDFGTPTADEVKQPTSEFGVVDGVKQPMSDFGKPIDVEPPSTESTSKMSEFESTTTQESVQPLSTVDALKVRLKIYGYILNYGEKIKSGDHVQSRMHVDALEAKFNSVELDAAQNHTNIQVQGYYYYAWRK